MRWLIPVLLRLYPADWRDRYEDEFCALLDDLTLTPSDYVNILLAALGERYMKTKHGYLRWLSGPGALLIVLIMLLGLIVPEESTSEALIVFIVMLPVVTLMPGLYRLFRDEMPVLSQITRQIGYGGAGLLWGLFLLRQLTRDPSEPGTAGFIGFMILIALFIALLCHMVWFILTGYMGLQTGRLPVVVSLAGIVAGVSWLVFMSINIVFIVAGSDLTYSTQPQIFQLLNLSIPLWIGSILLWGGGLAYLVFSGNLYRKQHLQPA